MKPEIRKDYIQDKYVIIAPKRGERPHDIKKPIVHRIAKKEKCVFCPENIKLELILDYLGKSKRNWQIAAVENKFPAVTLDNPKAYGWQEVIIDTPEHEPELENLSVGHISLLLKMYARRTKAASKLKKIEYILIFKNNGGLAGASILHSHSQLFATQFLPPQVKDKSIKTNEYLIRHGTCVYCDVIKKESQSPRLVFKDKYMIAFTPYASMDNYEIWLMPIRHLDNVTALNQNEIRSMAIFLKKIVKKITNLQLPYNYYFHQVINDKDQHLYMKIRPRGSIWAGVEIGSGLIINAVSPEEAARFYRK